MDANNLKKAFELFVKLQDKKVKLSNVDGKIKYRAPSGIMTNEVIEEIRKCKNELLTIINCTEHPEKLWKGKQGDSFPLTDVQSAYLIGRKNIFQYGNAACHIYMEVEYSELDSQRVEEVWNILINRHPMLRVIFSDTGIQKILRDEAGWVMNESTGIREKDGQQLSLNYTYWTDLSLAQDMALAIKTQLAEVGIDVTTTGQDQMTWWTEGVAGNYDITTWNTEGSYTEPHKFLQESLGADPHAISLQALEDFQSYSDAVNAFSTSADPEVVQSAIATALNVSNDNVIDLPISYSKDLVVYNSSKIAGYTFSSVPQFFEIDNVQPAE